MTNPAQQWDPEDLLQIGRVAVGITCVGYSHSKDRQCHKQIATANCNKATKLLFQISEMDIGSPRISDAMETLAHLLLCKLESHQTQISDIVKKWRHLLEGLQVKKSVEQDLVAQWEAATRSSQDELREWISRLEQDAASGDVQATILAQQANPQMLDGRSLTRVPTSPRTEGQVKKLIRQFERINQNDCL